MVRTHAAAGLLLLALTAHAAFASVTHFHSPSGAAATQGALQGREEGGRGAPLTGGDAQCLLCRLQRNYVLGLRHATPAAAAPPAQALEHDYLRNASARASRSLLRSGRAPPLV